MWQRLGLAPWLRPGSFGQVPLTFPTFSLLENRSDSICPPWWALRALLRLFAECPLVHAKCSVSVSFLLL